MATIKRQKTSVLSVSLPKDLQDQVVNYAKENDIPVSQFVKETLKRALALSQWSKLRQEFAPAFRKLGIKTDEEVESYFG